MNSAIRKDLVHGTTCGLALAGVTWALVLAPPRPDAGALACLVLAGAAGAATRTRNAWLAPFAAVAGLAGFGAGVSCLAALACTAGSCFRSRLRWFRLMRAGLASSLAAAAWLFLAGPTQGFGSATVLALTGHAAVWGIVHAVVTRMTNLPRQRIGPSLAWFGVAVHGVTGRAIGYATAWAWARPEARPLTAALVAAVLAGVAISERRRRIAAWRRRKVRRPAQRIHAAPAAVRPMDAAETAAEIGRVATRAEADDPVSRRSVPQALVSIDAAGQVGRLDSADRDLRILDDIARAAGYDLALEDYLTLVASHLASVVPYSSLAVYLLDPDQQLLCCSFAIGEAADSLRLATLRLGEGVSGRAAEQRCALAGCDTASGDFDEWGAASPTSRLRSTLAAPMVHRDQVLGVMTLYDEAPRRFSGDERRMLIRASGCAARVAHRPGGRRAAERSTLTDAVTGLPNARYLQLESGQRIADQDPHESGFGLLAFRVEGIDRIGESMGIDDADRLLSQIAGRFASACRPRESVVRFGPEQFLVLTDLKQSGDLVDRWHNLARLIEREPFSGPSGAQTIHLAAAHASYPDDGRNFKALLATLDSRLGLTESRSAVVVPFRRSRNAAGA